MPVAHASASPIFTHSPTTMLAMNVLASCTLPVRAHTSDVHDSRMRSSCAARIDALAHVPTRAAMTSGPPSSASRANAWVCADVSCATGVLANENVLGGSCECNGSRGSNAGKEGIGVDFHQTTACYKRWSDDRHTSVGDVDVPEHNHRWILFWSHQSFWRVFRGESLEGGGESGHVPNKVTIEGL